MRIAAETLPGTLAIVAIAGLSVVAGRSARSQTMSVPAAAPSGHAARAELRTGSPIRPDPPPQEVAGRTPVSEPYVETIPGTLVSFEMVPVPAAAGGRDAASTATIRPFWVGRTEVTWDEYDVYALGLDREPRRRPGIDAESRPSRPYGAPDRGFGHSGFAAISVTFHAATQYARWLSERTGRRYRLPTGAEWRHVCELAFADIERPHDHAWYGDNASGTTHAVGTRSPDALGLFDVLGNAAEWAAYPGGEPALHGASYRDPADAVHCGARVEPTRAWNETDPQLPKSSWWLSDAPFAGFRIVRDPPPDEGGDRDGATSGAG